MPLEKNLSDIPVIEWTDHRYTVGILDNGEYAAISYKSPFFCFTGKTALEVVQQAESAFEFYWNYKNGTDS